MEELERARKSYQGQMARKLTFDTTIVSWKAEPMKREQVGKSPSRKPSSSRTRKSSGLSSVPLALAKKKEQLALAQLKTKQVLREQELKRKMSEVQYAKEIMQAQVEKERAAVSFNVDEELKDSCGWIFLCITTLNHPRTRPDVASG